MSGRPHPVSQYGEGGPEPREAMAPEPRSLPDGHAMETTEKLRLLREPTALPDRRFEKPGTNLRRRREGSGPKTTPSVEVPLVATPTFEARQTFTGCAETDFQGLTSGAKWLEPREETDRLYAVLIAAADRVCVAGNLLKETTDVGTRSEVAGIAAVLSERRACVGVIAACVVGGGIQSGR